MTRSWRIAVAFVAGLGVALAILIVPTVWFRPWSIDHFYARVFLEYALARPMLLSQLRLLEPWGIDFHADELDDFSTAFALREAAKVRKNLEVLRSYPRESQSPEQRLSTDVLDWFLAIRAEGEPFLLHAFQVNQFDGVQARLVEFMLDTHPLEDARDAEHYVERLEAFGPALAQLVAGLDDRVERGLLPPRFVVRRVRSQLAQLLSPEPLEHPLYTHFADAVARLSLDAAERARLLDGARKQLEQTVYPAYRRLSEHLTQLEPRTTGDAGVWTLPDGAGYYTWALRYHTTSERSADEIHALGLAEVERLERLVRQRLEAEGYAVESLAQTLQALGSESRFQYEASDLGRARILADFQAMIDEAAARLPAYFERLPAAPVRVERVPPFEESGAAGAFYRPPPLDGSRPGTFFANLRDVAAVPRFGMRTLVHHEAVPGHHLQIAGALELRDLPFFRRLIPFPAYVEGWALYAERLAAEEGFLRTPLEHVGQLRSELFRAARLVVDTGLHAKRWTRRQAIAWMVENTGLPEGEVTAEVERYVVNPGQACAYTIGELEILELRERARAALGSRFRYPEFHAAILEHGPLPLVQLRRVFDAWLEARR